MELLTSGALLDSIRGVHWPARRVTRGAYQGGHRSKRVGSSPEFMQYRPYQQGDDPSKIDWKLFGRTERVAVRLTHDDSILRTTVIVDASASMAFPTPKFEKWELAAAIGLGLCAVSYADTDPVGLAIVTGEAPLLLPPRTRRGYVYNMMNMLLGVTPAGAGTIAPVLASLRSSQRIAIVSDFLGDAEAVLELSKQYIAAGREVFAVHIVAQEELDPRARGVVVDPEDAAMRRPLNAREIVEYQETFAAWRQSLADRWRAAGAAYQLVTTGEEPDRAIRRVVTPSASSAQRS